MQYAHNVDVPMMHTMQSTTVNRVIITTLTFVAMIPPQLEYHVIAINAYVERCITACFSIARSIVDCKCIIGGHTQLPVKR